eukprot:s4745_g5.t1
MPAISRAKSLGIIAVALNAGVLLLFIVHLSPQLQVLLSDIFSDEEVDYMIPPDPDPLESLEDETPVESVGSHILQTEAEMEWFADQAVHSFTKWKGVRHKEFWTPGPIWGGVFIVLTLFLNGVAPYVIRCYELQHQVEKEQAKASQDKDQTSSTESEPGKKTQIPKCSHLQNLWVTMA